MTAISTRLSVQQPNDPVVHPAWVKRLAGAALTLPRSEFDLAVSEDRARIVSGGTTNGIYPVGQTFRVVGEPLPRVWVVGTGSGNSAIAASSHARGAVLPTGVTIDVPADVNSFWPVTGAPSPGLGAVGDVAVDLAAARYYRKTGPTTWGTATAFPGDNAGTSGVSADAGNALGVGTDGRPFYNGAPAGTLPWVAGKTYAVGDPAIAPSGRLARAVSAHTSVTQFDPRKWLFPSDDGATEFDFMTMPDTPLASISPNKGLLYEYGVPAGPRMTEWVVKDGLFQENPANPSTAVVYFEGALSDPRLKVQHMWCIADVSPTPTDGNGITFIFNSVDAGINTGVHWGMLPRIGSDYSGLWGCEPYPLGFGGVANGPTHIPVQQPRGRTMRWDITVDTRTGQMTGYIDGKVVMQYTDINVVATLRHRAIFEIAGANFKVRKFGLSPHLPRWAIAGNARPSRLTGNDNTAITTLTASYQRLHSFTVGYDAGGAVDVSWSPFVNCSGGQVLIELGPADPTEFAAYIATIALPQIVAESGTNCRVAFAGWQRGTPGTTKALGIWARTTGTATVRQDTYGNNVGGPRWRHADYRSSVV